MYKSRLLHSALSFGDYQKCNGQHRANDVHVERNTCIAWREVASNQHLLDVSNGVAEQEDGGDTHGRRLEGQVAPKGDAGGCTYGQICHADLPLARAHVPPNKLRSSSGKENVKSPGPQPCDTNGEQQYP